jgi:hypothetical protein
MRRPARERTIVQAVPATRVSTVAATVIALLMLAVTVILAKDRLVVIITSVPMAVLWSGGMILLLPKIVNVPPPMRVSPDQLPPTASLWKVVVPGVTLLAAVGAAAVVFCLSVHEYVPVGIVLGGPILVWDSFRRAERTQRELRGILWTTTGFAWTSKDRIRYLSPER